MVYMNKADWPDLYKNQVQPDKGSNQNVYRMNFLHNVLQEQGKINEQIKNEILQVHQNSEQANLEHTRQIDQVVSKLNHQENANIEFLTLLQTQHTTNKEIMERLHKLEEVNHALVKSVENEALIHQAILDQIAAQEQNTKDICKKMDEFDSKSKELSKQLNAQEEIYKDVSEKLGLQEVYHNTVMERLDRQEALTQKVVRQLEHIRTVVFERATFLVEKFETNFNKISKPVQRFFIHHEETEDKEEINN